MKYLPFLGVIALVVFMTTQTPPKSAPLGASLVAQTKDKTLEERIAIKSNAIVKALPPETHSKGAMTIEIQSIEQIEGGVQIYARAWKNGQPVGFSDGTVEIERFRIFNPPVLVNDPTGDIVSTSSLNGVTLTRRMREDPAEAIRQTLIHTITVSGKDGTKIQPGKRGNTTDTFFASYDMDVKRDVVDETWANIRGGAGNGTGGACSQCNFAYIRASHTTNQWRNLTRFITNFDTSAIGTDSVTSATLSLASYTGSKSNALASSPVMNVYSANPASDTALVAADYSTTGTTAFATGIAYASWNNSGDNYNDFTLNASGIAYIDGAGYSNFASKFEYDSSDSMPTWFDFLDSEMNGYTSEWAGTSLDPKLVVVHSAAVASVPRRENLINNGSQVINNGSMIISPN